MPAATLLPHVTPFATPFVLRTLGDLVLSRDGERVGEARRKPLAVLAYVGMAWPSAVNRETLAALLWAESSPEKAKRTLAQTLYALRKECGDPLVSGTSQLLVEPAQLSIDATAFREAVGHGDYERAVSLYGGPFLDGVYYTGAAEFDQWVDRMRTSLAAAHRDALLGSARTLTTAGDLARAVVRLQEAHGEYPEDAGVLEALAEAYVRHDAAPRARDVIDAFERRLRTDYDLPLPASLQRLRARLGPIAAKSPASSPALSPAPCAEAPPATGLPELQEPPPAVSPPRQARRWPRVAAATAMSLAVVAGTTWFLRDQTARPNTLSDMQRLQRFTQRQARFGPFDSSTIGRVAILPPVNRTGDPGNDSLVFEVQEMTHRGLYTSYATAVPSPAMATVIGALGLTRHTPATPQQVVAVFERTGAALVIQPQFFRMDDSVRVRLTFSRHTAHTPGAVPNGMNVEQYEDGRLDGVEADGHRAAWAALGPLQEFVQSLESCVRPEAAMPPSAPWCWTKGRHVALATARPSRLRTWWWKLQMALRLTRPPQTVMDQLRRQHASAHAARRRAIDSSHMGRTVVLPARNLTGDPTFDSVAGHLEQRLHHVVR